MAKKWNDLTPDEKLEIALTRLVQGVEALVESNRAIQALLERQAANTAPARAPNLQRWLGELKDFDWSAIDAKPLEYDEVKDPKTGEIFRLPTIVEWRGYRFPRRSPENKFGEAVWYSRSVGRNAGGEIEYDWLISFRQPPSVDPISRKAEAATIKNGAR